MKLEDKRILMHYTLAGSTIKLLNKVFLILVVDQKSPNEFALKVGIKKLNEIRLSEGACTRDNNEIRTKIGTKIRILFEKVSNISHIFFKMYDR